MSGHSKWHNIKRQKGIKDIKKGKIFSKMSRMISVAARKGGGDESSNASLRLAVQKAKDARMPKENIERAIKKGTGELDGANYEEVVYEGFGPNGGAFMLSCLTDNLNRTVAELRVIFNRVGGNLGTKGSAAYIFDSRTMEPTFTVDISTEEEAKKIDDLLDILDDHDDVQDVHHNYKFPEE